MIYVLSFRTAPTSGAVGSGKLSFAAGQGLPTSDERSACVALAAEPQITLVIHGFNVDEDTGITNLGGIAASLKSDAVAGALVEVLWPGDSHIGPIAYATDAKDAVDTAASLAAYFDHWIKSPSSTPIHFVTHSLGARVALEAIKLMHQTYTIGEVCLTAAAVDDDCLALPERYRAAVAATTRTTVLASRRDGVLSYIYPLGDLLEFFTFPNPGDRPRTALGRAGPRRLEPATVAHEQIDKEEDVGHPDYITFDGTIPHNGKVKRAAEFMAKVVKHGAADY